MSFLFTNVPRVLWTWVRLLQKHSLFDYVVYIYLKRIIAVDQKEGLWGVKRQKGCTYSVQQDGKYGVTIAIHKAGTTLYRSHRHQNT